MGILCFGGSFNPIHHGHLICARAVAEQVGFDRVLLIPSAQPPHKPDVSQLAEPHHRLAMCRLAIADDPLFEISDIELTRQGPSYTIVTARELKQSEGFERVHWLIGADMLRILPTWHQPQALLQEVQFVIMARPGWKFDWSGLPPEYHFLKHQVIQAPQVQISATEIRHRVRAGRSIRYLLPPAVEKYILAQRLFQ